MVKPIFDTFEQIGQTGSTNAKLSILQGLASNPQHRQTLAEILEYTYNPYFNFWLEADLPKKYSPSGFDENGFIWDAFRGILDQLRSRHITGDTARSTVQKLLEGCHPENAKWLVRIINRDLEIKVAEATILKVFPKLFPQWKPQKGEAWDMEFNHVTQRMLAQPKYDGYRCIAIKQKGNVTLNSYNGKPLLNFDHIAETLMQAPFDDVMLDGEVYSPDGFNVIQRVAKTKNRDVSTLAKTCRYAVFDTMPLEQWEAMKCPTADAIRWGFATQRVTQCASMYVEGVEGWFIGNDDEMMIAFQRVVQRGFEGLMLKVPGAPYAFKRAQNWWKCKDFYEADLTITGAYEGDEPSTIGTLGGVNVQGELTWKEKTYFIDCKCGGGFKTTERNPYNRNALWAVHGRGQLVGRVAEIKFQEVTKNEEGKWALRFPTFLRLRDDK